MTEKRNKPTVQRFVANLCPACQTKLRLEHANRVGSVRVRYATCPTCKHRAKLIEYMA